MGWLVWRGLAAVLVTAAGGFNVFHWKAGPSLALLFLTATVANAAFSGRPTRFALGYAASLVAFSLFVRLNEGHLLHVERNFFGVKKVMAIQQGRLHVLTHGTTIHGIERMDAEHAAEPLAYYRRGGPVGDLFRAFEQKAAAPSVAVVGLGAGAVASYAQPGQTFVFYEIDPGVVRIARNPDYFKFLALSRGRCEVVLGDGRLALGQATTGRFGMIFLDAYSSDAIPVHLLSREAVRLYLDKLEPHGLLVFDITNRFMHLEPIIGNLARDAGLVGLVRTEKSDESIATDNTNSRTTVSVAVLARKQEDLEGLAHLANWRVLVGDPSRRAWTDQYSDVLGPVLDKIFRAP